MVFRQVSISKLMLLYDRSCHSIRRHYLYHLASDSRPSLLLQALDQLTGAEPWRHGHAHAHSPPWRIDRRHLVLSAGRASSHITCYECLESRASGLGEARVRRGVQDVDRFLRRRSGHPAHGDRWVKWRSETERESVWESKSCGAGSTSITANTTSSRHFHELIVEQYCCTKYCWEIRVNDCWQDTTMGTEGIPHKVLNKHTRSAIGWLMSLIVYFTQRIVCVNRIILLQIHS